MKTRVAGIAAAAAILTLLAGCGGSSGGSDSTSGSTSGSPSSSKDPIKVLTYGNITGLAPTPQTQLENGVKAAIDAFNAAGGVQGRKIELITCDTKLNPAQAATCVSKAGSQGVVAAIPSLDLLDNVTVPLLEKQGIPILGINPSTATAQYSKMAACFVNGPFVLYPQAAGQLAQDGAKTISFLQPEGVADQDVLAQASNAAAQANGGKVSTFIGVAPDATDFSTLAAKATSAGEDATYISATPPGLFSLLGALAKTNPQLKLAAPGYIVQDAQILGAVSKIPTTKGMYVNNYTAFPNDTSVPGIKRFLQQIDKADATKEIALFAWADAWGATQIIGSITSGDITKETVLNAMKTATVDFQGVMPNWKYSYNTLGLGCVNNNQVYTGTVQGAEITPTNGGKSVTGLSQEVIDLYKKSFAKYAR
jgi:ABC-type branched-subunit amino acid transport system substrate-binding protein